MMGSPSTATQPYIHQKSIVVDDKKAFLGSVNFSYNSLDHARELGILFDELPKIHQLTQMFNADFAKALPMPQAEAFSCPAHTWSLGQWE